MKDVDSQVAPLVVILSLCDSMLQGENGQKRKEPDENTPLIPTKMGASKFAIRKTDFLLGYHEPTEFIRAQWDGGTRPHLITVSLRLIHALLFLAWMIYTFTFPNVRYHYTTYTYWSLTTLFLDTFLKACITLYYYQTATYVPDEMNWALKSSWILGNISHNAAFIVTIAYWSLLFDPGGEVSLSNGVVHISNALQAMMNLCIDLRPFRIHHFYIPFIYSSVYIIFTGIFYAAGGMYDKDGAKYAYFFLNWDEPEAFAKYIWGLIAGLFVVQCLLWLLSRIFRKLWTLCLGEGYRLPLVKM
ncbi:unnamed protein product [Darwinula stevensoni]|uniref:Protein rolling stone n=1 Tax=Darwinula stevensoni TaxID=69355 RepID=A0A7R8X8H8_9CRUS|nr:unnamed protein product [Darwinula stevensoni]CAG0883379.1 unnamed protein product [Darwinula stevensoni]